MEHIKFIDPNTIVVYSLEERNSIAQDIIARYRTNHGFVSIGIGLVAFFPGAVLPTLFASIITSAKTVYRPMIRELEIVYRSPAEELSTLRESLSNGQSLKGSDGHLVEEFSPAFFQKVTTGLALEIGMSAAGTFLPFLGGVIAAGLEHSIMTKITSRLGIMVSMYFQNGGKWVGNIDETYEIAKNKASEWQNLNKIRWLNSDIKAALLLILGIAAYGYVGENKEDLTNELIKKNVPPDLIKEAVETLPVNTEVTMTNFIKRDWYRIGFEDGLRNPSNNMLKDQLTEISAEWKSYLSGIIENLKRSYEIAGIEFQKAGDSNEVQAIAKVKMDYIRQKLEFYHDLLGKDIIIERNSPAFPVVLSYQQGFNEGLETFLKA